MNEIEEYLNIVEQIKTSDKEKEALSFILNGFALCTDLLEKERQEKQELIDYLKEKINKIKEKIEHYDLWHEVGTDINFLILKRQLLEEILNKIEKR